MRLYTIGEGMVLYLDETDVEKLITMDDAIDSVRDSFRAQARDKARNLPRRKVAVDDLRIGIGGAAVELPTQIEGAANRWVGAKVSAGDDNRKRTWMFLVDGYGSLHGILPARR